MCLTWSRFFSALCRLVRPEEPVVLALCLGWEERTLRGFTQWVRVLQAWTFFLLQHTSTSHLVQWQCLKALSLALGSAGAGVCGLEGRRVAGSSTGCASVGSSITLSLRLHLSCAEHSPEMDKDFNVCLKKCTWCPFMLGKVVFHFMGKVVWGTSASCLVSSRTQTIKKGRDFIRARKHLGNSGFPGIFADFSNGSSIGLQESSQKWAEKGQRGRSRRAPVPAGCSAHALAACGSTSAALSCRVWAAALRTWHSSSAQSFSLAFELGHFCSSPASSVVINGTPGAK